MSNIISLSVVPPEKGISITELSKQIGKSNRTIKRIIQYLGIPYPSETNTNHSNIFRLDNLQVNMVIDFLKENPDTRSFFNKQTCLKKYGVDNVSKVKVIREKVKQTCLDRYGVEYSSNNDINEKRKKTILEKYGVDNISKVDSIKKKKEKTCLEHLGVSTPSQSFQIKEKIKQTCLEKYGVEYYTQTPEYKERHKKTCLEKYGVEYPLQSEELKNKLKQTCLKKYGVDNVSQIYDTRLKSMKTCLEKYGVEYSSQNIEIRKRMLSHKGKTSPEKKMEEFLKNRGFNFQYEYDCNGKNFDFAIFKDNQLSILIEIDGEYYHGLLNDSDNVHVKGDKDCERFSKVPDGVKFIACDSLKIEECFSEILRLFDISYDTWIKEIINSLPKEFPYPEYTDNRLKKDFKNLCCYNNVNKSSRLADSTIRQFHKSIWSAHVGDSPSPYEAWQDRELLEKCVRNRFIYSSNLSSQAIANGFNVCKLAPKVSVFSASLAKYLILKYLNEYNEIFDPFSGFSGRMLGTCACGKHYVGQDINYDHVKESNEIIKFHSLNALVIKKDILEASGNFECLFTCPPYGFKETWGCESSFKSCDEWITECITRFSCKKYLFVVDNTEKYKNYVVERISNSSHFGSNSEQVILITC